MRARVAVALLSAAAPAVSEAAPSDWTAINPVTPLTAGSFAQPPATDQPWARINLPPSGVTIEGLQRQLQDLAAAHVAGAEYGQGAVPTQDQFKAILVEANRLGIKVSLSHGPTQNPTGYSINGDNARKNLFFGAATVNGGETYTGAVPPPTPANANTPTLVAVLAYRCDGTCAATGVQTLDRSSALDLTATVTGKNTAGVKGGTTAGSISWTAPAGQWRLIAFWSRGVFAQPDPFSTEGTNELIASMETYFTPELKDLMAVNGGDVMYDSHSSDRGSPDELWTNDMAAEFRTRAGYELVPSFAGLFYK